MTTPAPLGFCYDCVTGNCPHESCKTKPDVSGRRFADVRLAVTLRNGTSLCVGCARRTDDRNRAVRNGGHMAAAS